MGVFGLHGAKSQTHPTPPPAQPRPTPPQQPSKARADGVVLGGFRVQVLGFKILGFRTEGLGFKTFRF